jgi:centromeric protein E
MTGNHNAPGVIPRAISEIFSIIETTAAQEQDVYFYVRISYVELYNNNFRNLLENASKELAMKEKHNGVSNDRYLLTHLLTHSPTHSLTYLLTHLLTHSPTYLLTY